MASSANSVTLAPAPSGQSVAPSAQVTSIADLQKKCQTCGTREHCLPVGLNSDEMKRFDSLIVARTAIRKSTVLYHAGDPFAALYAIRLGTIKTTVVTNQGHEQVAGFHILGEIIGFDGVGTDRHRTTAIALEDTEVCVVPFAAIEKLTQTIPALQHNLHRLLSNEIARDQSQMLLLGSMQADERVAMFLLDLADRYSMRGYSSAEFELRMTREEIGSYLGVTLETVSRCFSLLQARALIQVQGRRVRLLDSVALKQIVGHHD